MFGYDIFEVTQLSDAITRIKLPGDVFSYIVEGSDWAAVIDTGLGIGPLRAFVEEKLGGKPYDLILTHGHVDHAGGASQFDKVWMNEKDVPLAGEHTEKAVRAGYLRRAFDTPFTDDDLDAPKKEGYTHLEYGKTFPLGGETLEIVCMGGHTVGSIGVLFHNARILLSGDACCSFTLMFEDGVSESVRGYRENLQRLWDDYSAKFDTVIYSHPHNYGGPEVITQMIELCDEILAGTDDKIPGKTMNGTPAFTAKAVVPDGPPQRADGKISNLLYTQYNLQ